MALTVAPIQIDGSTVPRVEGNRRTITQKVTFDSSYPNTGTFATSGYAITPSTFGLSVAIEWLDISLSNAAHLVFWDQVNSRIHVFTAQGTEVGNGVNLSTVFANCQVYGE